MLRTIERQRYFIDFTLASLWRRWGKNLALLLAYSLIVALLASVMLFSQSLRQEARLLLQDAPEILIQRLIAGRQDLIPASYLARLGTLRGVKTQQGRVWGYHYDPAIKANYTLMTTEGVAGNDILIGTGIARARGLSRGDYLSLRSHEGKAVAFRVRDLLEAKQELVSSDLILMGEASLRSFFGIAEGFYTDLMLQVSNPHETRTIAEKISRLLPDTRPILREEILRTYDAIFNWREGVVFVVLIGALLAFIIFAWDKASGLSAEERQEIGILKAVGWETGDVLRMKFWEGGLISLSAFLLGYLLAYLHVFMAGAFLFEPVLKGWATLYPDFHPRPVVDGLQLATLFFFTVVPYTLATLVPIWHTAITDPDTVMR